MPLDRSALWAGKKDVVQKHIELVTYPLNGQAINVEKSSDLIEEQRLELICTRRTNCSLVGRPEIQKYLAGNLRETKRIIRHRIEHLSVVVATCPRWDRESIAPPLVK